METKILGTKVNISESKEKGIPLKEFLELLDKNKADLELVKQVKNQLAQLKGSILNSPKDYYIYSEEINLQSRKNIIDFFLDCYPGQFLDQDSKTIDWKTASQIFEKSKQFFVVNKDKNYGLKRENGEFFIFNQANNKDLNINFSTLRSAILLTNLVDFMNDKKIVDEDIKYFINEKDNSISAENVGKLNLRNNVKILSPYGLWMLLNNGYAKKIQPQQELLNQFVSSGEYKKNLQAIINFVNSMYSSTEK